MHSETAQESHKEEKTISIKLPKIKLPSFQSGILLLLILVGALQTVQLFALDQKIASAKVNTSGGSTTPAATPSSPANSALPEMVGGC